MDIVEKQNPSRTRVGTAVRERGVERAAEIIRAAQSILVREGLAKLTTRRVARELGISVGNLAYYFSSKESLLQAIIEDVIRGYDDELEQESKRFPDSPPKRFKAFLQYMIGDAKKADVQGFFYQFWGLSSHNELAAALRLEMYTHFSEQTAELLADVHPDMPDSKLKLMALSVITSLEGLHVVYGSSEPFLQQYEGFDEFIYEQILLNVGIPPGP
jgi:AcrR family transcriptional regulator